MLLIFYNKASKVIFIMKVLSKIKFSCKIHSPSPFGVLHHISGNIIDTWMLFNSHKTKTYLPKQ